MKVNLRKFIEDAGLDGLFYPGKRLVRSYPQPGEFKGHSVVLDWHDPAKIRVDLRAGASGRALPKDTLKKYPVSYQTPTHVEISVDTRSSEDTEEGEDGKSSGKGGGGGGFRLARKPGEETGGSMARLFGKVTEGSVPAFGKVTEMVVMGMKIGAEAIENVLDALAHQIAAAKVSATDLLSKAGQFVTRYMPPSFLAPRGDETAVYKYDREKNEPMFGGMAPS